MKSLKSLLIVLVPFTGVGLPGFKDDRWFRERLELFKHYTLKSLLNQTDPDFWLWLTFRPEERHHPLLSQLELYLAMKGVRYVMTFDGLMYWDDKFGGALLQRLLNMARVVRRAYRSRDWRLFKVVLQVFTNSKNKTLLARLGRSLAVLSEDLPPAETIYLSRIDSDDMFHQDYVRAVKGTGRPSLCTSGYIYDHFTQELAYWNPPTSPPFHTIAFDGQSFFIPRQHLRTYGGYTSHEDAPKVFETHHTLPPGMYCILTHQPKNHISTVWAHPFRGDIITETKTSILKQFGIFGI